MSIYILYIGINIAKSHTIHAHQGTWIEDRCALDSDWIGAACELQRYRVNDLEVHEEWVAVISHLPDDVDVLCGLERACNESAQLIQIAHKCMHSST